MDTTDPDYRAVGLATLNAARDAASRWVFPDLATQGLEPWTGTRHIAIACSPHSTHAVDVTDSLPVPIAALQEHRAYLAALAGDALSNDMADADGWLTSKAKRAGARYSDRLAEIFEFIQL